MRRPAARTFQDLVVWRNAHELVLAVYRLTAGFPKTETYGLALQMRRAAVSIPANIAEGFRRRGKADKARHRNIAESSLEERRYYLLLARPGIGRHRVDHDVARRSQPSPSRVRRSYSGS
jgi:four helix bundle protein